MGWRADTVSTILIATIIIGNYWLLRSGLIDLTLFVQAIISGSVVAIFGIFWWTWGDRITRLLKGSNKTEDQSQHTSEDISLSSQEKQLNLLIKPLYIAFDKYKDWTPTHWEINMMIFGAVDGGAKEMLKYKGLPLAFSIMFKFGPNAEYLKSLGADEVDSAIDVLQQYGNLAQPQLRELIKQYFEIRQKDGKSEKKFWNDPDFINIYNITNQMNILVKKRYEELMWEKDES